MTPAEKRNIRLRKLKATKKIWKSPGPRGFEYPVTVTQFDTLRGLIILLTAAGLGDFFCSQSDDGTIVLGTNHVSVNVNRWGRVQGNRSQFYS